MHTRLRHVALLIHRIPTVSRGLLRGVRAYFGNTPRWAFHLASDCHDFTLDWVSGQCDGIITNLSEPSAHRRLRATGLPTVCLLSLSHQPILPTITEDNFAIGQLVAEHFLARGHRHFAFVHSRRWPYSTPRLEGFRDRLGRAGHKVFTYSPPRSSSPARLSLALCRWIRTLPRPVAVLAANDSQGLQVLDACRRLQVVVPHDLAVIAVGNDVEACSLCWPPLSSVAISFEKMGYEGAAMLKRILDGRHPPRKTLLIPPQGVVTRQSSETWAVDDPLIARAVRYITEHACDPVGVQDVARHVGYSYRRLLERFEQALGRGLHEEIRRVQIDRAKRLLAETDLPVHRVATACGWIDGKQIGRVFRQCVGVTPGTYRDQHRMHAP